MNVIKRVAGMMAILLLVSAAYSQSKETTTIILLRHAEKQVDGTTDPDLSSAGMLRAQKLLTMFTNAKPTEMYATPYKRTRQTLQPWATTLMLSVQDYDAANQPAFAKQLAAKKGKTIVVAGHSNTIPPLVNLLLGSDKYQPLADDEYNKIFVVTLTKGKAKVNVITY